LIDIINYHEQILKEFDHIFEDERSRSIREKWAKLIPKVFEVAENDQSSALQELYADLTQCTSKGIQYMYMYLIMCVIKTYNIPRV